MIRNHLVQIIQKKLFCVLVSNLIDHSIAIGWIFGYYVKNYILIKSLSTTQLNTFKGPGKVIELDVPKEQVVLELSEGGRLRLDKAGLAQCGWQPKSTPVDEITETAEPEDNDDIIPEELIED